MWPGPFEQTFVPQSHGGIIWNLTLTDQVVSEEKIFKEYGRRRPTYTITSPVSLRFRWANNVSLRKRLQQEISEPEFNGDLVYRIRKNVGKSNFAEQFRKFINRYIYKRIGYNPYIMRQTACLVVNQITVDSYALLFNWTAVVRGSDSMKASS